MTRVLVPSKSSIGVDPSYYAPEVIYVDPAGAEASDDPYPDKSGPDPDEMEYAEYEAAD